MSRSVYRVTPMPGRPLGLVCAWVPIPNARWHRGHRMPPKASSTMTMAIAKVASSAHRGIHVTCSRMSGAIRPAKKRGTTTRPTTRYCLLRYSRIVFTARDSTHRGAQCNARTVAARSVRPDSIEDTSGSERRVSTQSCRTWVSAIGCRILLWRARRIHTAFRINTIVGC
jgi:hypothetical protein